MASFSQRHGYKAVREQMQSKSIDDALSNELWDTIHSKIINMQTDAFHEMWREIFGRPIDEIPTKVYNFGGQRRTGINKEAFRQIVRDFYFKEATGTRNTTSLSISTSSIKTLKALKAFQKSSIQF